MASLSEAVDHKVYRCDACQGRSSWDFLHDFYARVDTAHEYARMLESKLDEVNSVLHQTQSAHAQCETSLVINWEALKAERVNLRNVQEALMIEREKHLETKAILDQAFREAAKSGEIADLLEKQLAALQATSCGQLGCVPAIIGPPAASAMSNRVVFMEDDSYKPQSTIGSERAILVEKEEAPGTSEFETKVLPSSGRSDGCSVGKTSGKVRRHKKTKKPANE